MGRFRIFCIEEAVLRKQFSMSFYDAQDKWLFHRELHFKSIYEMLCDFLQLQKSYLCYYKKRKQKAKTEKSHTASPERYSKDIYEKAFYGKVRVEFCI